MDWRDMDTAPQDESTFLAAIPVHNNRTGKDHWEYAIMYFCEGRFEIADLADTGWGADDYTHWAPLIPPPANPTK